MTTTASVVTSRPHRNGAACAPWRSSAAAKWRSSSVRSLVASSTASNTVQARLIDRNLRVLVIQPSAHDGGVHSTSGAIADGVGKPDGDSGGDERRQRR